MLNYPINEMMFLKRGIDMQIEAKVKQIEVYVTSDMCVLTLRRDLYILNYISRKLEADTSDLILNCIK